MRHGFILPSVMDESAHFPTSSPTLYIVSLFSFATLMSERCFSSRPILLPKIASRKFGGSADLCLCSFPHCRGEAGSPGFLSSLPQLVPPAVPRFWELGTFQGGKHRSRAGRAPGASATRPGGAQYRLGEPLSEWPLRPALPDPRPPPAAWICAHCTRLHPELHPGTILGREGTGRRVSKGPASYPWLQSWGGRTQVSVGGHMASSG